MEEKKEMISKIWDGKNKWITMGAVTLFLVLCAYVGFAIYYMGHFYPNTTVNGVECSTLTVTETKDKVESDGKNYVLHIGLRNGNERIVGKDIAFSVEMTQDGIQDKLSDQTALLWIFKVFGSHEVSVTPKQTSYDSVAFQNKFNNLMCFDGKMSVPPKNAYISQYTPKGFQIVSEQLGTKVNKEAFQKKAVEAIKKMKPSLDLNQEGLYEKPRVYATSSVLKNTVKGLNRLGKAKITYTFGKASEVVDGNLIRKWCMIDAKGNVTLRGSLVSKYIESLARKYNTMGISRWFKTSYKKTVHIKGGDYGWWINVDKETKTLVDLVQKGKAKVKEPSYRQRAGQYGKNDIGNTYVEVNLSAQHLYFYKNGKKIIESDFVSGNISKGNGTPAGVYPLLYKQHHATLRGADYATPVEFWMPFNGNIGLHDALWRYGKFGGTIYKTNGSHGCVNLPYSTAKKIFNNISPTTAIVCYKLPSTEQSKYKKKTTHKK